MREQDGRWPRPGASDTAGRYARCCFVGDHDQLCRPPGARILAPTLQRELGWSEAAYGDVVFVVHPALRLRIPRGGAAVRPDRRAARLRGRRRGVESRRHGSLRSPVRQPCFPQRARCWAWPSRQISPAPSRPSPSGFPTKERAFATGIFNAGTNTGAINHTPPRPLDSPLTWVGSGLHRDGRARVPLAHSLARRVPQSRVEPRVSSDELAHIRSDPADPENARVPLDSTPRFQTDLGGRSGKLLADPIWWFYLYWLPKFLDARTGSSWRRWRSAHRRVRGGRCGLRIGGGWLSSFLIKRGWTVNRARKTTMLAMALLIVPTVLAPLAGEHVDGRIGGQRRRGGAPSLVC